MDFFKNLFADHYEDGARSATDVPIVFIDPDDLGYKHYKKTGDVHPDALETLKNELREQMPNVTGEFFDDFDNSYVEVFLENGPFSVNVEFSGTEYCIINKANSDLDHKNEIAPLLAGHSLERIREIPGADRHWDRLVGIHEGQHCNDAFSGLPMGTLLLEVRADQAAVDWLVENDHEDIARAMLDYRALSSKETELGYADIEHASTMFVSIGDDKADIPIEALEEAVEFEKYANGFPEELAIEIALHRDIEMQDVYNLDWDEFMESAREVLDAGYMQRPDPYTEQFARDFVEHYEKTGEVSSVPKPELHRAMEGLEAEIALEIMYMHDDVIDDYHAEQMRLDAPEKWLESMETALEQGAFKRDNPFTEELARDYIEAFRRQIVETEPKEPRHGPPGRRFGASTEGDAPADDRLVAANDAGSVSRFSDLDITKINGGGPEVSVQRSEDIGAPDLSTLYIGGVGAPEFFASFADPAFAEQRITNEQQQLSDLDTSVDNTLSLPNRSETYTSSAPVV